MFRPVQNPDDEEAEGRVRTRTRTKELVNQFLSLALLNYLLVLCVCARARQSSSPCLTMSLCIRTYGGRMYYMHASNWNRSTTARHKEFFCFVSFFLFLLIYTTAEVISTLFQFVSFPAVSVLVVFFFAFNFYPPINQPTKIELGINDGGAERAKPTQTRQRQQQPRTRRQREAKPQKIAQFCEQLLFVFVVCCA